MFQDLLVRLSEVLEKSGIPYMVIGGQAVLVYGEPRFTKDIDITLGAGVERLDEVLRSVVALGWKVLPESPAEFVQKTMVLPCQDPESGVRLDLIFSFSPYERQAMGRVRRIDLMEKKYVLPRPRTW